MAWRLIDLGGVDGFTMTNLYEAVARTVAEGDSPNTLIFNYPAEPFVNVGYHQVVEKEVDVDFVRQQNMLIVRRSIGGGTILDGPWEQDYFFIVNKKSEECPANIGDFYRKYLSPVADALQRLGVSVQYKPINDLVVRDRKISGNGGISIGDSMVLAGDVLLDLPTELMTRILKVPDEKFRDKLKKSLSEWMTSLKSELGEAPNRDDVKQLLVEEFTQAFCIETKEGKMSSKETKYLGELLDERKRTEWIFMKDRDHEQLFDAVRSRQVKVKEGVSVCEGVYKAQKLIRITMETADNRINDISISGDFFTDPYIGGIERLERLLVGTQLDKEKLRNRIISSFDSLGLKTMGMSTDDLVQAILKVKQAE